MSILLDTVNITTGMVWSDRYSYAPVAQNVRRTLGGTQIVEYGTLNEGTPVTLSSLDDQGWLTKLQVDALQVLAEAAGGVYTLTIGSDSYQVMFRHEESPAVDCNPLIPRTLPLDDDWFVGTIKLMTV
jgi:hypothetical protein